MAKKRGGKDGEKTPTRRRVVIVNADGSEPPQLELAIGDPVVLEDDDGRRYLQFRIA